MSAPDFMLPLDEADAPKPAKKRPKYKDAKTPLMRQYWKIKERHPQAILLFRMGDFYETFDSDARLVSQLLGLTLTKRANGKAADVDLAGFPHHALDNYLPKLVQAGHRVAICEQLEDPKLAKKIVKRGVVEVVTPGVSFHDHMLTPKRANYLAAVYWGTDRARQVGLAFVDATTGEFSTAEVHADQLEEVLQTINPAELLFDKRQRDYVQDLKNQNFVATPQEDWCFGFDFGYEVLRKHFQTHSLKGFGIEDMPLGLTAAGAVLYYLGETQKGRLGHIRRISPYSTQEFIALDPQTQRNLELVASMQDGTREGSLIEILDATLTPMGGRLLRKWLVRPLRAVSKIQQRLEAVDAFFQQDMLRQKLRDELAQVGDLERAMTKVCMGRANPRDLVHLKLTLKQIPVLKSLLAEAPSGIVQRLAETLTLCTETIAQIEQAMGDDPPANLTAGGVIRAGFSPELDELRQVATSGKDWVAQLQATEAERTGITSLKIGYNKVFGYYLEVTNAHKDKVPEDYIRKQTLVNAERYITPALKEYEEKILTAEERIGQLEATLFNELRMAVAESAEPVQRNGSLLAMLDCFVSMAEVAQKYGYTRPVIEDSRTLHIQAGRHPVVERTLPPGEPFIPNDITLDPDAEQILLITGPNMAGKSVVLRQVGLIVLLAQVGSFVPAEAAQIGVVDKIFTRVGASDNLAAGESTFLVEMNETANILNNATPKSLILLDEVGRGTSTFDGLSIAWAIVEHLHENAEVAARTLFATHYHELNALAQRYPRIRNARIQVQEHEGRVIFLRKLIPGGADHSYGIEVARMAGLPQAVIARATDVLQRLEAQRFSIDDADTEIPSPIRSQPQQTLADLPPPSPTDAGTPDPAFLQMKDALNNLDLNRLTPLEALMKLAELQNMAREI